MNGSQLAVGCKNGTVVIRSEDGTKTFEIEDHKEVTLLRWNREPGGAHFLASGHKNGVCRLYSFINLITMIKMIAENYHLGLKS